MTAVAMPTMEDLQRKGVCVVDHINHCEYDLDGFRYSCGWSSEGVTRYSEEHGYNVRDVVGWIVYKRERAA